VTFTCSCPRYGTFRTSLPCGTIGTAVSHRSLIRAQVGLETFPCFAQSWEPLRLLWIGGEASRERGCASLAQGLPRFRHEHGAISCRMAIRPRRAPSSPPPDARRGSQFQCGNPTRAISAPQCAPSAPERTSGADEERMTGRGTFVPFPHTILMDALLFALLAIVIASPVLPSPRRPRPIAVQIPEPPSERFRDRLARAGRLHASEDEQRSY